MNAPQNLDELQAYLMRGVVWDGAPIYPGNAMELDISALPTFGGDEPDDTSEIWSWDENRYLVGTHCGDLEIYTRSDWDGE